MANTIILKRSATPGKVPTTAQLALGEIAINTYDGLLYIKKDDGTPSVVQIGGVTSVNGETGAVTLDSGDVTEGTNLYFTQARARSSLSAGTGISYNSSTGVISTTQNLSTAGSPTFAGLTLTGGIGITGSIIPSADITYDLGSPTKQWKDIYVGPGSLYVNGQKVLQDDSGTITFTADTDENIRIKTLGTGVLQLGSSSTTIQVDSTLQIASGKNITDASGIQVNFGDNIQMNNNKVVGLGTPSANTDAATKGYVDTAVAAISTSSITQGNSNVTVTDTGTGTVTVSVDGSTALTVTSAGVVVAGNLTVSGTTTTVDSNTVTIADNILTLNSDATGAPTQNAGIEVERGDEANVQLRWNEGSDKWTFTNDGAVYYPMAVNTDDLAEGSTNQYFTTARARNAISASSATGVSFNSTTGAISLGSIPNSSLSNSSITINGASVSLGGTRTLGTDDVAEGSTNKYYTDARARAALSAGTGISYNSTTGAISTSAIPNSSLTNSKVTIGTTDISLGASSTTLAGLTSVTSTSFTGALTGNADTATSAGKWTTGRTITLGGDLTGSVTIDGSANVTLTATVAGNSVALGTDTTGDYVASLVAGTGISLSNNAGEGATPTVAVDTTTIATKAYVDSQILTKDNTDEITEGTTNLYFTNARARGAISVSGSLSYNSTTGVISYTTPSTSGITEGTNLYYTDARARAAVSAGTGISYNSSTGVITNSDLGSSQNIFKNFTDGTTTAAADSNNDTFKFRGSAGVTVAVASDDVTHGDSLLISLSSVPNSSLANSSVTVNGTSISLGGSGSFGTDSVTEGTTNKYYTDARARAALSFTAGSGAYNSTTGVITIPTNTNQLTNGAGFYASGNNVSFGTGSFSGAVSTGALTVTGAITATGEVTAYFSDLRLKTNIVPVADALEKVEAINGVTFDPNEAALALGVAPGKQMGVIAQEIEAVAPELVTDSAFAGYKTVRYDKLTALLIEAVKELSAKVKTLEAQLGNTKPTL